MRVLSGFAGIFGTTAANQGLVVPTLQLCAEIQSPAVVKEGIWQKK